MKMVANNEYHKASNALVFGGLITYIAGMLLLMSFASPYWIQSFQDTFSEFKHMGLWEYCFDEFRYPYYPFDKIFKGCNYVFSQEYYVIRDWLLPSWLMVVQAFVTLGLMLSFVSQIIIALELVRWPLKLVLKYEYLFSSVAFICNATSAALVFLAVAIFGGQSWRRDWLMYPNYNYLSWSYGFACLAFMFHVILLSVFLMIMSQKNNLHAEVPQLKGLNPSVLGNSLISVPLINESIITEDARKNYEIKKESKNLVVQMDENPSHNGGYV